MKLSSPQVERTLNQFEANVIPEDHPAVPRLNDLFGDHTFFVDSNGLNIVEPTQKADAGGEAGQIVKLASWTDASRTSLEPHEPESTDLVVVLEPTA